MHAALDFAFEHRSIFENWHLKSNSVVILAAKDEEELRAIYEEFISLGRYVSYFEEPDIGDRWTSICIEPHEDNKKLLSWLPLAGKVKDAPGITRKDIRSEARVV
jgi:hypothetical protein